MVRLGLCPRWMLRLLLLETYPSMSSLLFWEKSTSRTGVIVFASRRPFRSRFGGIFRQTDLSFNSLPDVCVQGLRLTEVEARGCLVAPVVAGLLDKSVLVTP